MAQESTGQTIAEICQKLGVSEQTFYRWKKKFGSMGVAEVRRLKQLEDENAKLKRLVVDLSLDKAILQDVLRKKGLTPDQRRGLVGYARDAYRVTERRACRVLCASRATIRYVSVKPGQEDLRMRIKEIAAVRSSWGSPRIHVLLRREGWLVNHKRTERLFRLEGLNLRRNRPRRRKAVVTRGPSVAAMRKDERWSMDFMHDQLQDGRGIRVLTVVDQYTREALATEARGSFSAHDVIDVLNRLSRSHRKPAVIQVDNGTEFASRAMDAWAYREDVRLDFSRPGKPTDNAHIESFNARLRAERLNAHVFESLEDAEETLTSWRSDYVAVRLHSALGMLTPREFAELGQRSAGR